MSSKRKTETTLNETVKVIPDTLVRHTKQSVQLLDTHGWTREARARHAELQRLDLKLERLFARYVECERTLGQIAESQQEKGVNKNMGIAGKARKKTKK